MAAKRRSLLSPKVRLQLEKALLEALRRHMDAKSGAGRSKTAPARKKKAGKKKVNKKRPARRRKRRA